jgi:hypothetical protein
MRNCPLKRPVKMQTILDAITTTNIVSLDYGSLKFTAVSSVGVLLCPDGLSEAL